MAWIRCSFFSEILKRTMNADVIIPEPDIFYSREELLSAKEFQAVYLLHGKEHNSTDWIKNTSVERYAMENQVSVVMPCIEGGKYEDRAEDEKYWSYITKELMEIMRFYFPLSDRKKDQFVIGIAEGGYGAIRWQTDFPGEFEKAIGISAKWKEQDSLEILRKACDEQERLAEWIEYDKENRQNNWKYWDETLEEIFAGLPLKRDVYSDF